MIYQKRLSCAGMWLGLALAMGVATAHATEKLTVVTSIRPLNLLVEQLVGGAVEVETLLPANADPHNMALRISERARLEQADLVVWLGPDFERFLEKPMAARAEGEQLVLGALPGINWHSGEVESDEADHQHHDHAQGRDMHLWLNPVNAQVALQAIYRRLIALEPNLQPKLQPRLAQALTEIRSVEERIGQQLKSLAHHGFGVDHNGYGHFVSAFNLNQLAAVNELPGQRMSAKQRYQLQQQLSGAACLVVEREAQSTERLAAALELPVVLADPLANDPQLRSYSEFLAQIGNAFHKCLSRDGNEAPLVHPAGK